MAWRGRYGNGVSLSGNVIPGPNTGDLGPLAAGAGAESASWVAPGAGPTGALREPVVPPGSLLSDSGRGPELRR